MGCRYSPQRSQSNGKSNFQNELTNQKFDSNSKLNLAIDTTIMWSPSLFFISNRFYRTLNNFVSLNDHIITEFSWVVTMAPAVPSADILRWLVTSHWHRQDDCNCGVFVISEHTKEFLGLCHLSEWRRGHRSHTLARFWTCVTWLIYRSYRIQNCTYRKTITYRTPQSNLHTTSRSAKTDIPHIIHDYITGTGAILRLPSDVILVIITVTS